MKFEIKGHAYSVAKLSVFDQLKVTRKLLPVLAGLMTDIKSISALLPADGQVNTARFDAMAPVFEKVLPRIAEEFAALSEDDTNAIIHPCLGVVARQSGTTWTPVFRSGEMMFDDIDMMTMLQLVARVVADSLGNFLPELPTSETLTPPAE
ncbi:phage tail assembly chaperone [Enterobacter sp.]|uniref:phage tail assembly chaperone n=1 Tax=Enterobacter sp. TaxID=42895 RepID=UPI003D11B10A